jgi:UDP-N-acetylmuramoyl-tripeptide--D-alanyl-D-alanine ligase
MNMTMMRIHEAARAIGAMTQGSDAEFSGVSTDSRSIAAGDLFVALKGDKFDGHAYVEEVLARGAAGAMVSHEFAVAHPDLPLICVTDTRRARGAR